MIKQTKKTNIMVKEKIKQTENSVNIFDWEYQYFLLEELRDILNDKIKQGYKYVCTETEMLSNEVDDVALVFSKTK